MTYQTLCRAIAILVAVAVLARWRIFWTLVNFEASAPALTTTGHVLMTLVLSIVAVLGLWGPHKWGFFAFYAFSILFTIVFGASLVPFIGHLIPMDAQVVTVITLNAFVVALVVLIHWKSPR